MGRNNLLYLSGNDIPFPEAGVTIHTPTIKEIGLIGEESFYAGCELIRFSKDNLSESDKNNLKDYTNFDIIMSIVNDKDKENLSNTIRFKNNILMLLALLFPNCTINFDEKTREIVLLERIEGEESLEHRITNKNFEKFKEIINTMFCLTDLKEEYNPSGSLSKKIAEKLKHGRQKVSESKNSDGQVFSIFGRYVSILAVGEQKDFNALMNYTVFQLYDEFKRYNLKQSYDTYMQVKIAGGKGAKEPEDWTKDIYVKERDSVPGNFSM